MSDFDPVFEAGIDGGATLTKAVFVERGAPLETFRTFVCLANDRLAIQSFLSAAPVGGVAVTGGGAHWLLNNLSPGTARRFGEFESLGAGSTFLNGESPSPVRLPCILVSVGTGTSILLLEGAGGVRRVGGTALGGGTLIGLSKLLLSTANFQEVVSLASAGDRRNVDLRVGDFYEPGEIALVPDLTAANFGKVTNPSRQDLAAAICGLIGENVALLAGAHARHAGSSVPPDVIYAGSTLTGNSPLRQILTDVTVLTGARPHFLPRGEFAGALGALILLRQQITMSRKT